jgi:glycosyltransferase involved in cell wall biosynthesis
LKYSIIIPTLNEEKLLPGLLRQFNDSALKKNYDYEIIISDGGSSDKTIEIALEFSDVIKVHVDSAKQNIAIGRNRGAHYANGNILIFLNGDVIIPDVKFFFEFIDKKFDTSEYAAMTCKVLVFPEEENISDKIFHYFYNKYFYLLNVFGIGMGRGECQVIKKDFFRIVNGNNENLEAGEDFDLFKRINKHGKILFTNKLFVYESPRRYRKLGYDGVTWSWIKNAISILLRNKSLSKEWEQVR